MMLAGIDLGTTFSCMAYIDEDGRPKIVSDDVNGDTVASVISFNGKRAYVGDEANGRKGIAPLQIFEFVKRDMGRPAESEPDGNSAAAFYPKSFYEFEGFKFGATAMSAIILRKMKRRALEFAKTNLKVPKNLTEQEFEVNAVITVPAYFNDRQRKETRLAGQAAGLNVIGIINEPSAAALAYGLERRDDCRILVFDLGGGTFDVTLLEMKGGEAIVKGSDGVRQLGGRDWDVLIESHIHEEFKRQTGKGIPLDDEVGYEIQQLALKVKFGLSAQEKVTVTTPEYGGARATIEFTERSALDSFELTNEVRFAFEERSSDKLKACSVVCENLLERTGWKKKDIDEILMAGGACRMPMIPRMMEKLFDRKIKRSIEGFNYDTAIAKGAALYAHRKHQVRDVSNNTVGVRYREEGAHFFVEHLILRDTSLPARNEHVFEAEANATLIIMEGESKRPDECTILGKLPLDNPKGQVRVIFEKDPDGILRATADYHPHGTRSVEIIDQEGDADTRLKVLRNRIQTIDVR